MEKSENADFKLIKNSKGEIVGHVKKLWFVEFLGKVYDIWGLYFDSIIGFNLIDSKIKKYQKYFLENNEISIEDFNEKSFNYGIGNPGKKDSFTKYISKIGKTKERNKRDGENYKIVANLCLVLIYHYWEDYYREKIANANGHEKNELKLDIFNDIRIIRHSIIHNKSIAIEEVKKLKFLKWFKKGDKIEIDAKQLEQIIEFICYSLVNDISEEYKKYGSELKQPKIILS
jgi:hypothetical protein